MPMRIYGKKAMSPQRRRLRLRTPLASGGWGLCPQTFALLLPPTAVAFVEVSFQQGWGAGIGAKAPGAA